MWYTIAEKNPQLRRITMHSANISNVSGVKNAGRNDAAVSFVVSFIGVIIDAAVAFVTLTGDAAVG